ncbi:MULTISPECIES: DUF3391 domain-containing protein [Butyricimonas]|uniref:DUF3391 domain-containing protein n=1 Tax=Butyricimonas TaxID=574697 RepID=UPI0011DCF73D|nr:MULTISPECIES: DUF3391 domain-containing protein [Butyricimonas]
MPQECWFTNYRFPVLSDPTKVIIIRCNLLNDSLPKTKRTGMKEHLIKTWLFSRSLLEEAAQMLNIHSAGSRAVLEINLCRRSYKELKEVISKMYSK